MMQELYPPTIVTESAIGHEAATLSRNGYASLRDLESPSLTTILDALEAYQLEFLQATRGLWNKEFFFTGDSLHHWSRQWEYPYCIATLETCSVRRSRAPGITDQVRFRWNDYRAASQPKTMTLAATEFIRRFLLHVLPVGFQRIRYYGLLGNRHRVKKLARCRQLLGMAPASVSTTVDTVDYRDRLEALTGVSLRVCPMCHDGQMIAVLIAVRDSSSPATINTS